LTFRKTPRQQFGQHAEKYRKSAVHGDQNTLEHIVHMLAPKASENAIDIGCGGGHMSAALAQWVRELVAVDVTPQMLIQTGLLAREKGLSNVVGCVADARNLPFAPEIFDLVTCRIVLHHVPRVGEAIAEMGRVLKVGGRLLIQDILGIENPFARAYMDEIEVLRDPSHVKDYNSLEWNSFLTEAKLGVIRREVLPGSYRLKDWTSRSGASKENYDLIVRKLEDMPENVRGDLKARFVDGDWTIPMRYILVFAGKTRERADIPSRI